MSFVLIEQLAVANQHLGTSQQIADALNAPITIWKTVPMFELESLMLGKTSIYAKFTMIVNDPASLDATTLDATEKLLLRGGLVHLFGLLQSKNIQNLHMEDPDYRTKVVGTQMLALKAGPDVGLSPEESAALTALWREDRPSEAARAVGREVTAAEIEQGLARHQLRRDFEAWAEARRSTVNTADPVPTLQDLVAPATPVQPPE